MSEDKINCRTEIEIPTSAFQIGGNLRAATARARADMEQVLRAYPHLIPHITKCIERAVREERERAAKIAEEFPYQQEIAARIRGRAEK